MKPLANNEHTLKDSFEFTHQILGLDNVPFMCSFDIVSLFTCIPVKETIELCLDLLYKDTELVHNLTRSQFKKLLVYCVQENQFFIFFGISDIFLHINKICFHYIRSEFILH